jgi:hypothetical protein
VKTDCNNVIIRITIALSNLTNIMPNLIKYGSGYIHRRMISVIKSNIIDYLYYIGSVLIDKLLKSVVQTRLACLSVTRLTDAEDPLGPGIGPSARPGLLSWVMIAHGGPDGISASTLVGVRQVRLG